MESNNSLYDFDTPLNNWEVKVKGRYVRYKLCSNNTLQERIKFIQVALGIIYIEFYKQCLGGFNITE